MQGRLGGQWVAGLAVCVCGDWLWLLGCAQTLPKDVFLVTEWLSRVEAETADTSLPKSSELSTDQTSQFIGLHSFNDLATDFITTPLHPHYPRTVPPELPRLDLLQAHHPNPYLRSPVQAA